MADVSQRFNPTSWTVVLEAAGSESPEAQAAMAAIYSSYWQPLYYFVRRQGHSPENAADLLQGFFLKLIEKETLRSADPSRGRFRTFLLTALKRFIINDWQASRALKRGGAAIHLSLDLEHAESVFIHAEAPYSCSERNFDRSWALEILNKATQTLQASYEKRGKGALFEALRSFLPGCVEVETQEQAAARIKVPLQTFRSDVHRVRQRFKDQLRSTVRDTLESADQVDDEIRYLISVLSN